jgi:hypothetical protein
MDRPEVVYSHDQAEVESQPLAADEIKPAGRPADARGATCPSEPLLDARFHCSRCHTKFVVRTAANLRWYACSCPRRISVLDIDGIVIGLAYEHRRRLGEREFLALDDELAMVSRLVAEVRVGVSWSRPTVRWTADDPSAARGWPTNDEHIPVDSSRPAPSRGQGAG